MVWSGIDASYEKHYGSMEKFDEDITLTKSENYSDCLKNVTVRAEGKTHK